MDMHTVTSPAQEGIIEEAPREESTANVQCICPQGYDLGSCMARFRSAAFFGLFLDILILLLYDTAILMGFRPGIMGLIYTLIEVPVIWGILGIFFYREMLDLAGDIARRAPFLGRWLYPGT